MCSTLSQTNPTIPPISIRIGSQRSHHPTIFNHPNTLGSHTSIVRLHDG